MTQPQLLPVEHRSRQPRRLKKETVCGYANPERVFAAQWLAENRKSRSSGYTTLDHILTPDGQRPRVASQRDADVAASVIQWLATNCGAAFLRQCEAKIDEAHARAIERRQCEQRREACRLAAAERTVEKAARVSRRFVLDE